MKKLIGTFLIISAIIIGIIGPIFLIVTGIYSIATMDQVTFGKLFKSVFVIIFSDTICILIGMAILYIGLNIYNYE